MSHNVEQVCAGLIFIAVVCVIPILLVWQEIYYEDEKVYYFGYYVKRR